MITTVARNLQNLTSETSSSFDVITRTGYNGTFVGQNAGSLTQVTGLNNTGTGFSSASALNTGTNNTFMGAFSGSRTTVGNNNTYIGNQAGEKAISVSENIFIGSKAGQLVGSGNNSGYNVFLGNRIAFNTSYSQLSSNILIGHDINTYNSNGFNNTIIGHGSVFKGENIIGIGQNLKSFGSNNIILGDNVIDNGKNNFIVGKDVKNNGTNNVIIITDPNLKPFVNNDNNIININGVIKSKDRQIELNVDDVNFGDFFFANSSNTIITSKNITLSNDTNGIEINNNQILLYNTSNNINFEITNEYQSVNIGSNINSLFSKSNIQLSSFDNKVLIDKTGLILSSSNNLNTFVVNNNNIYAEGESIVLTSLNNTIQIDESGIGLFSSNDNNVFLIDNDKISIQSGENVSGIFSSNDIILNGYESTFIIDSNGVSIASSNDNNVFLIDNDKISIQSGENVSGIFSSNDIILNGYESTFIIDSNGVSIASSNDNNVFLIDNDKISIQSGENVSGIFSSNDIILNGYESTFIIDSNGILVSTSEAVLFQSGSNIFGQFSNSNIILHGYENNLIIDSNGINISGTTFINNISINGDFTLCNWLPFSNYVQTMLSGFVSLDNTNNNNSLSNYVEYIVTSYLSNEVVPVYIKKYDQDQCPALTDSNHLDTFMGSIYIERHLHVEGVICAKELNLEYVNAEEIKVEGDSLSNYIEGRVVNYLSNQANYLFTEKGIVMNSNYVSFSGNTVFNTPIKLGSTNEDYWWEQYVDYQSNVSADLVFRSKGGMMITFNDDFYPEVLNFTGKHRCVLRDFNVKKQIDEYIGKIVIATGEYSNLYGESEIGIDEAIPVVSISEQNVDKRVFGVVAGIDIHGCFRIGNIQFKNNNILPRVIIQSSGEGGIWVTNINGDFENGDLITTCIIPGLGAKQSNGIIMNYSICKITCDCNFTSSHALEVKYKSKSYKKQFVGCVYLV